MEYKYLQQIIGKLAAENVTNFSDYNLEEALKGCVGAKFLIPLSKEYRDKGLL